VAIVGGGLFPRTALVLRRIAPACRLVIIDADPVSLARARDHLARAGAREGVELREGRFPLAAPEPFDLVVLPLAFVGDRDQLYRPDGGPPRLVHDWLWRTRGEAGARVSLLLAKRLNLVRG
jgi:hypothetical protein